MNCSYYLFDSDKLEIKVSSEVLPSGTEEVGISFRQFDGENKIPSQFTIKFRDKAFDRAIELAQELSDEVMREFKESRKGILGLKENSSKGGDAQKENIKGLSVLNSQNMDRVR
jgi:hypothetical protein